MPGLAFVLAHASVAGASVELRTKAGGVAQPYQRWANQAQVPTPDITLTVFQRACPGQPLAHACVFKGGLRRIYMNPHRVNRASFEHRVFLHEVGHFFDFTYMTGEWRTRFKRSLDLKRRWWWGNKPREEKAPPGPDTWGPASELFAQAYAHCGLRGPRIEHKPPKPMIYEYQPTPRQHKLACRLIDEVPLR
jgi:hypothetical protein